MSKQTATIERDGYHVSLGPVDWDKWESGGNAEPTSRVLEGSRDHGYDQEWIEPGLYDGEKAQIVYLLADGDLLDDVGEPYDDLGNVAWEDHVARIVLID
ncbi:MAG: hypothetical protein ABFD94_06785 [Armatimonadia bacterium]